MGLWRNSFVSWWNYQPLQVILLGGLFIRLWAAFFSPGYLMVDDHFLTVEIAGSWANGFNTGDWIPGWGNTETAPQAFSFLYNGILFVIYKALYALGMDDPQHLQWVVRVLHGMWSLLSVYFVYQLTLRLSNKQNAVTAALLMAFLGLMPLNAVRNLVEVVSQPLIIGGVYYCTMPKTRQLVLGGVFLGLSVGLRFQNAWVPIGWGFAVMYSREWRKFTIVALIAALTFFLSQLDDILLWGGKPFQHLIGYFEYNAEHAGEFPNSPWAYLSWLSYFILPPISLFIFIGALTPLFKKNQALQPRHPAFWGVWMAWFVFTAFHILFPNKQERFLFPVLPLLLVIGTIGWNTLVVWRNWERSAALKRSWSFFWIVNGVLLVVSSNIYPKKARVESMYTLYQYGDAKNFVQEHSHRANVPLAPKFYSDVWDEYYCFGNGQNFNESIGLFYVLDSIYKDDVHRRSYPNYVLFYDDVQLSDRVNMWREKFPNMKFCKTIEPGSFDRFLHWINPVNSLEKITIYRIPKEDQKKF
ncbi:MAG: hypothetical protein RLY35_1332 [Bacteroidota bacterium]|jgi:hypothetical protein